MLIHADCLNALRNLPDNSVDSVVTDPPYGLSFMGKKWDYDVPSVDIWRECLRVLKPGGYLLSFAGTRTQHRIACGIEDAGFEIRDMIAWVYGSGFPKSLDVGKAIDKMLGNERDNIGANPNQRPNSNPDLYTINGNKSFSLTRGSSPYEGYGTALKPAHEPITVARKPIEGTVAANVLKWGTGAINIDGCRVKTNDIPNYGKGKKSNVGFKTSPQNNDRPVYDGLGRFPANLIHDGSDEVLAGFPETGKSTASGYNFEQSNNDNPSRMANNIKSGIHFGDSGSAARFFYKAPYTEEELCNANIVEKNLSQQKRAGDFVLSLVAIEGSREGTPLSDTIQPFMNAMRSVLRQNSETNTTTMLSIGQRCLQELRQMITEELSRSLVKYAEIQLLTNTMMTIQSLLNTDGFVEAVMSDTMLLNMVLGEADCRRFSYCAKASKAERNMGCEGMMPVRDADRAKDDGAGGNNPRNRSNNPKQNHHPTVKPLALMRYLIKLVTPPDGVVLDPFLGSGTTAIAAVLEGRDWIGIEREAEYCDIARARIAAAEPQQIEVAL